jgi:hypothetical protein
MTITIDLAKKHETQSVIDFFARNLDNNNDWIYNKEFLCPHWTRWAIIKHEIVVIKEKDEIIWACRFYKQKRKQILSLYQFAIEKNKRWTGLVKDMLDFIGYPIIHTRCSWNAKFNNYYMNTWRKLLKEDKLWKQRELELIKE